MKVYELIEVLQSMPPHVELAIAYQPHYPIEVGISNVRYLKKKVYLAAGTGRRFAPNEAWDDDTGDYSDVPPHEEHCHCIICTEGDEEEG